MKCRMPNETRNPQPETGNPKPRTGKQSRRDAEDDSGAARFWIIVGAAGDNERLDRLLSREPRIGSRAAGQRLIAAGLVLVNGRRQNKNFRVRAGQTVEALLPQQPEQPLAPEAMDLSIFFEDDFLLIVDKPAGVVVHPARGHQKGTLVQGLLSHRITGGGEPRRPGIVHRLDKDTSGLLIVAKDEETHRRLSRMLAAHKINRTYLALVHGLFQARSGTVEAPLARDSRDRKRMSVARGRGRGAVTHFEVLGTWPEAPGRRGGKSGPSRGTAVRGDMAARREAAGGFSLLEVRLETGRTHQIRVHLAAIGHPVAGDKVYGRRRDPLAVGRQFLHSARLEFAHPVSGETVEISSPLPADLQAVLDKLGTRMLDSGRWTLD